MSVPGNDFNRDVLSHLLTWREIEEEWMNEAATQDIPDAEFALDVLNYEISELALQVFITDNPGASLEDWDADGNYVG